MSIQTSPCPPIEQLTNYTRHAVKYISNAKATTASSLLNQFETNYNSVYRITKRKQSGRKEEVEKKICARVKDFGLKDTYGL